MAKDLVKMGFGMFIVYAIILGIILTGCDMPITTDEATRRELKAYAEAQYEGPFTEVSYEPAADKTQSYVLTLEDGNGVVFNVSKGGESGKIVDDYINCIVDAKLSDYLRYRVDDIPDATMKVMAITNIELDIATVQNMSAQEYIDSLSPLYSLIFVCQIDAKDGRSVIMDNADALLRIYNELTSFGSPEMIDFNVVSTVNSAEVSHTIQNLRKEYDGAWYRFDGVSEYISTTGKIYSANDLLSAIETGNGG